MCNRTYLIIGKSSHTLSRNYKEGTHAYVTDVLHFIFSNCLNMNQFNEGIMMMMAVAMMMMNNGDDNACDDNDDDTNNINFNNDDE